MIIPGKIPYIKKATIKIMCSLGTMINQHEWVAMNNHRSRFGDQYPEPYQDLQVIVELDNNVLFEDRLTQKIEFEHMFEDSESITEHVLKISLSGLVDSHRVYLDNVGDLAPMMRIEGIWIEQLSMRLVFEDHGQCFYDNTTDPQIPSEFVGQNGTQVLKFSTPIYPWLMSVQKKPDYFY
jgi:hypothetical protein